MRQLDGATGSRDLWQSRGATGAAFGETWVRVRRWSETYSGCPRGTHWRARRVREAIQSITVGALKLNDEAS